MRSSARPVTPRNPGAKWIAGAELQTFQAGATTAHRIFSSADCWIERFGEDALISYRHDASLQQTLEEFRRWQDQHSWRARRIFGRFLPRQNEERSAPRLIEGDPALPLETVVEENGMRFGIDFAAGYAAGLFIDQRANRAFIRRAGVKRLLNTFSYTCSFSVAAVLGGAAATSIDLSKKSIDRGRENFLFNGIDPAAHRFYADDVLEMLPRFARKQETFDAIILDPPTFSRGNRGRRFQVERDFEALLLAALELAALEARVLLSTNCTRLTRRSLENIARYALKTTRRSGSLHAEPELPDVPAEFAAQSLWLTLK